MSSGTVRSANDFRIDPEHFTNFLVEHQPKFVVMVNPNSPTGQPFAPEHLLYIVQLLKDTTFFIDEAWTFFRNPRIKGYIVEALKTWRKQSAAMILSTQSLDELRKSDIVDVIIETCATKIFLANPDMDRGLYRNQFHLNETEINLIASLIPKRQFLIKNHEIAKVANLEVDPKSYWLYTNDPFDNRRRAEAFEQHGFERGLEVLAGEKR